MAHNYQDVNCPNCGKTQRTPFIVESVPFGSTTVKDSEPKKCFHCKEYFKGTVETVYSARKLYPSEKKKLGTVE